MIRKLQEFFIVDEKLLYISDDFVGYDPQISEPLSFFGIDNSGRKDYPYGLTTKAYNAFMGPAYDACLLRGVKGGPVRGFTKIEVYEYGDLVISYHKGSRGFGVGYTIGSSRCMRYDYCLQLFQGRAFQGTSDNHSDIGFNIEDYYLARFQKFQIPFRTNPEKLTGLPPTRKPGTDWSIDWVLDGEPVGITRQQAFTGGSAKIEYVSTTIIYKNNTYTFIT